MKIQKKKNKKDYNIKLQLFLQNLPMQKMKKKPQNMRMKMKTQKTML